MLRIHRDLCHSCYSGVLTSRYSEKLDLNEGRLAQSFKESSACRGGSCQDSPWIWEEQRDWVNTIENWSEIKEISFVDEEDKNVVSVYMSLYGTSGPPLECDERQRPRSQPRPGLHEIALNKVCVWMTATTLEASPFSLVLLIPVELPPEVVQVRVVELRGSNW